MPVVEVTSLWSFITETQRDKSPSSYKPQKQRLAPSRETLCLMLTTALIKHLSGSILNCRWIQTSPPAKEMQFFVLDSEALYRKSSEYCSKCSWHFSCSHKVESLLAQL